MASKTFRLISSSCERPVVRVLLLAVVFALVALAFQWHFERRMAALNAGYVQDSGRVLSGAERGRLGDLRGAFKQTLGMDLLVRVEPGSGTVQVPAFPASTLFVGVNPHTAEAVFVLPPLAKKVMGEGQRLLAEEGLSACARTQPVALCLEQSVSALFSALTAVE